jgi:two-component system cell cycle sensor histidine kinase PleC
MARTTAARASSRAEIIWGAEGFAAGATEAAPSDVWLKRLAFIACAICLVALAEFGGVLSNAAHERLLVDAASDLDMFSKAVWRDLAEHISEARDKATLNEPLSAIAPHHAGRGRRVLVTDARGHVVASWPQTARAELKLSDVLGDQPLIAERSGAMRVVLSDGTPALAILRRLPAPYGELATIQPQSAVLLEWRAASWRYALLFATTTLVLLAILAGYLSQTQRLRHAEEVNRHIRRRLATALSSGHCGLWDWDIAHGRVYWSDSMHDMLGRAATQRCLTISELAELIHPDDRDLLKIAAAITNGRVASVDREFRIRNADGAWVWMRARAEVVADPQGGGLHLVGIAVDVSEQKKSAEAAALADHRLRDAIDAISEAFVLWDAESRLVTCNSKFLELNGVAAEDATPGRGYRSVMASATAPLLEVEQPTSQTLAARERAYEVRLLDGRWLQINERRTKDGGHVSVGADITQLKRNEESLLLSERRLVATVADLTKSRQTLETQKQQLATLAEQYHFQKSEAEAANLAKSEFLANMSHELRTPLNAIVGFSEMMLQQPFGALGSDKYVEYCRDIHRSGAYLSALVADILEMSRLEYGGLELKPAEVDVDQAIADAARLWRHRAGEKRLEFRTDVDTQLCCSGDRDAIVRILGALLSNSVKFTAPGGGVRLRARRRFGHIHICIADNGQGVEREAMKRLGAPFMQSRAVIENGMKGSGLGLAIARALADLHGGSLRLRSRLGVGTVAVLRLPIELSCEDDAASSLRHIAAVMKAHSQAPKPAPRIAHARVDGGSGSGSRNFGNEKTTRKPGALSSKRKTP